MYVGAAQSGDLLSLSDMLEIFEVVTDCLGSQLRIRT